MSETVNHFDGPCLYILQDRPFLISILLFLPFSFSFSFFLSILFKPRDIPSVSAFYLFLYPCCICLGSVYGAACVTHGDSRLFRLRISWLDTRTIIYLSYFRPACHDVLRP